MLTESEIKAYTVDIPNDIQAAQRASGCASATGYASMTPEQRLAWLKERYRDTYGWVNRQPCTSYDFVAVPIESLENLLRGRSDA